MSSMIGWIGFKMNSFVCVFLEATVLHTDQVIALDNQTRLRGGVKGSHTAGNRCREISSLLAEN